MTRPDDEFPPLDVTSTLNLGALDDVHVGDDQAGCDDCRETRQ